MFVEYDWTYNVYCFRHGENWTAFRGYRHLETLKDVKTLLECAGCKLGRKTDSRTWEIVAQ